MPTRKQRRRREKSFRHDYDYVLLDEEGNEIPLDPEELRAEREAKEQERAASRPARATSQPAKGKRGRTPKEVQPPTWERAFKRGGLMGALMLFAFLFVLKSGPLPTRIGIGVFYGTAFVPLTYWIDRTAYRGYQRRMGKQVPKKS